MAKRKKRRKAAASPRKAAKKDSAGLWIALLVAVVAVVGLVLLYQGGSTGAAVVKGIQTTPPEGILPQYQEGAELGRALAANWDGVTEANRYCSYECGVECSKAYDAIGLNQKKCFRGCNTWCRQEIQRVHFR